MFRIGSILLVALLVTSCNQKKDIKLDTDDKKASYAIGQQIGRSLKAQGVKVNIDVIAMSIDDVLNDKDSRLSDEEIGNAIRSMREQVMAEKAKEAEDNKKEGAAFLEKNKSAEGVKVTESGLQYKVIKEGSGAKPKKTDTVKVHYVGTLIDGTEFDSSIKRDRPAEFPVQGVIPGWTEALQMMPVGSKWELAIPSELAYGPRGRPGIPANSTLKFEVELLEIVKKDAKK